MKKEKKKKNKAAFRQVSKLVQIQLGFHNSQLGGVRTVSVPTPNQTSQLNRDLQLI